MPTYNFGATPFRKTIEFICSKYILLGVNEHSVWKTETYAERGILFLIFGTLFNGAVFGMPVYGIYGLISKKWDEKIYMIIISIISLLSLFIL